jgi:hypothetical protein
MLYKHGRLEKKLREDGRTAPAEILSIRTEGSGGSAKGQWSEDDDLTGNWSLCRLQLRVMPPSEASFEVSVRTRLNTLKFKGDTVPVLYDPDDHDKVVVDYQSDARSHMEGTAEYNAGTDADLAELARLAGSTSEAAGGGDFQARLDRLQQLGDLHDRGVLSDGEFAAEKAKLLSES